MKKVTFAVTFLLMLAFSASAQTIHQRHNTPQQAFAAISSQPVSVGTITTPGSEVSSHTAGFFGGLGGGYTAVAVYDIFGQQYPQSPYGALIASAREILTRKVFESARNVQEDPAAAPQIRGQRKFLVNAYLAVAEGIEQKSFDGQRVEQTVDSVRWEMPWGRNSSAIQQGIGIGSRVIGQVATGSQKRKVKASLIIKITDAQTTQILWMNDGWNVGEIEQKELSYKQVVGFGSAEVNYPNSYMLAQLLVEAAWK